MMPPETITSILHGSWTIQVLKSAVELGLFDGLSEGALTAAALAQNLGYPVKGVSLMLDSLVGMGLLVRPDLASHQFGKPKERLDSPALYALSDCAAVYLVKESPLFMGMYLKQHDELDKMWRYLKDTVKSGQPVMHVNNDDKASEIFPHLAESIIPLNYAIAEDACRFVYDTVLCGESKPLKVLDVAAGSAVWSIPFARAHSGTTISALDFPAVLKVTERIAAKFEVGARLSLLPGNWRDVQIEPQSYDVAILGHILHSEGYELSEKLLSYCFDLLKPGGTLIIAEFFANRNRTAPLHPLMFGLNMYLATTDGCIFSIEELSEMALSTGFNRVIRHNSVDYVSPLLFAVK